MFWSNQEKRIAVSFATKAHMGQIRKYGRADPYVLHPMRVAGLVTLACPMIDDFVVEAAWLHDVLEDTETTAKDLRDAGFDDKTIQTVQILTRPYEPEKRRKTRVAEMVEKMRNATWEAKLIKLADRCDNLADLDTGFDVPLDFIRLYVSESLLLEEVLQNTNEFLNNRLTSLIDGISDAHHWNCRSTV